MGGLAVDRLPRLWPILASDALRGGLMILAAVFAWQDALALWHLYVLVALFGLARALFAPAFAAAVPDILPADALPSANSLRSLSRQAEGIAGPALGGVLVAQGGTALAFALDGASFVVAARCVAAVARQPALRRATPVSSGVLHDLWAGFATVLAAPWLWISIAVAGVSSVTLAGPLAATLPLLVEEQFDGSVGTYALLNALSAAGAVGTAIWLGRASRLRRRGPLTYGCRVVAALALATLGLPLPIVGAGLAMAVLGAAEAGVVLPHHKGDRAVLERSRTR